MGRLTRTVAGAATLALLLTGATAAMADVSRGITDQKYHGGKYTHGQRQVLRGGGHGDALAFCPVEHRGIYRGDLYCYVPVRAVRAPRHQACPAGFTGFYRGNIFCTEQR
ncbi:hypothetical protein [uncultured Roseobacter sp.]|uniref:hypothetical protein n=1 Tax=uncultured Roseobacter sp. TaxID=114847 RepID=UPI0026143F25|nr:hypothetical protein [uncultured Roseobacter sp.]